MSRIVRNWTADRVEDAVVAPHRYTWAEGDSNRPDAAALDRFCRLADWKAALPYQVGDVVWLEVSPTRAVRARIHIIIRQWDRFGDARPLYRVQVETAKGLWSKHWINAWAGHIQRGYYLAGLAPDLEGNL